MPLKDPLAVILMLDSDRDEITPADWEAQKKWIDEQLADATTVDLS